MQVISKDNRHINIFFNQSLLKDNWLISYKEKLPFEYDLLILLFQNYEINLIKKYLPFLIEKYESCKEYNLKTSKIIKELFSILFEKEDKNKVFNFVNLNVIHLIPCEYQNDYFDTFPRKVTDTKCNEDSNINDILYSINYCFGKNDNIYLFFLLKLVDKKYYIDFNKEYFNILDCDYFYEKACNMTVSIEYFSERLRSNKKYALIACQFSAVRFVKLSQNLKDDLDILKIACSNYPRNLKYSSDEIKKDKEKMMQLLYVENIKPFFIKCILGNKSKNSIPSIGIGECISYIHPDLQEDDEIIEMVCKTYGLYIKKIRKNHPKYDHFAKICCEQNHRAFKYLREESKTNKQIILSAMKHSSRALKYIKLTEEMQDDKEIVMISSDIDKRIKLFSERLRDDKGLMLKTKKSVGIQFLSERLKDDEDIILNTKGSSILYASERLRKDEKFVRKYLELFPQSYHYIDESLKNKFVPPVNERSVFGKKNVLIKP